MRLKGKVAIVTGAAAGIGKQYARRLVEEGARVVLSDVVDGEAGTADITRGGQAVFFRADVAKHDSVQQMVTETVTRFGAPDILVNNAAVFASLVPKGFQEIPEDEWDRVMAVNVKGVWNCARAVAPHMIHRGGGRIINIASPLFHKGTPALMHYVASKGAVIGITRALARELGGHGVCVNAIAPGLTLSDTVLANAALQYQREAVMASRAIKRDQTPGDLEGTLVFLSSNDSSFMTGQTLIVDGGSALI
jgi:NAD(P)-dependent dehydrogenase (short-subunit alcohol dehydrogenase family)